MSTMVDLESAGITPDERTALTKRYCRVVAIIDDEIEDATNPGKYSEQFSALRNNLDDSAIICHLHNYETFPVANDDEKAMAAVDRAYRIACAADLVIIDWHLGLEADPKYALLVIGKLIKEAGIRFVLINTNVNLNEAVRELKNTFNAQEQAGGDPLLKRFKINDSFFISLRKKPTNSRTSDQDANKLIEEAQRWLASSFPDHLHWAGLELAVRVREMLPKVIAVMPKGTNAALLHQLFYQRGPQEIAAQITEVFLDDLKFHFGQNPLKTASDSALFELLKKQMIQLAESEKELRSVHDSYDPDWQNIVISCEAKDKARSQINEKLKSAQHSAESQLKLKTRLEGYADSDQEKVIRGFLKRLDKIKENWRSAELEAVKKNLPLYFPGLKPEPETHIIAAYLNKLLGSKHEDSLISWASLKEGTTIPFDKNTPLFPGCVLKRRTTKQSYEYLLCISPACDCYTGGKEGYLFVSGKSKPTERSSPSITQLCFQNKNIAWNAEVLVVMKPKPSAEGVIKGYTLVGAFRSQFTSRIIHRVWSFQSRVGVDTSEYYRLIRGE
jgi:hypothetical protein